MRRFPLAIGAASLLAAVALPASASATEVQIGQTSSAIVAPTCPANVSAADCTILLTEETAVQTVSDGTTSPDVVSQTGNLTYFTVGISSAAKAYISGSKGLNAAYGGPPEVELTVLRPVGTGTTKRYEVAATGPLENLTNYQGEVIQFSLTSELPVVKGEVVALTTPTWAPVISIDMDSTNFNYLQSRTGNCAGKSGQPTYFNPQDALGEITSYSCSFPGNRVEYAATELTAPTVAASIRRSRTHFKARAPRVLKHS